MCDFVFWGPFSKFKTCFFCSCRRLILVFNLMHLFAKASNEKDEKKVDRTFTKRQGTSFIALYQGDHLA